MVPQACANTGGSVSMVVTIAAPIAAVAVTIIVIALVICLSLTCHRMRRKKNRFRANSPANDLNVRPTTNEDRIGISLQYNQSYFQSDSTHQTHNTTVMGFRSNTNRMPSAPMDQNVISRQPHHSYEISSLENSCHRSSFAYEGPYLHPACQEKDLKHQLQMLRVEEISKDNIEYVRLWIEDRVHS